MRVFISGLAGFLPSHLADALIAQGHTVVGCDNLVGGDERNVPRQATCEIRDCHDPRLDLRGVDCVIHCAALPHEGASNFSPSLITNSIYGDSVALFSRAIACGVGRILFCSSMARFGTGVPPFAEGDRLRPVDPYGIAKVAAEHTLRSLCKTHGVEYAICVPHSIFGPRQRLRDPYRNVIAIWMNLIMQGKSPVIYGDGSQLRCFSYVTDCAPSIATMATMSSINGQVVNIGPDEEVISVNDAFKIVATALGKPNLSPMYLPPRPNEVHRAWTYSGKARELLGYKTEVSFQEGVERMAEWALSVGPQPFQWHVPIEIGSSLVPKTWLEKRF